MNRKTFTKQLIDLIAFETITGNIGENTKALDYVETILPEGIFVNRVKNKNAEILIASTTKRISTKIGCLVHIDVVDGRADQFKAKVIGDKIIGRGASDMKFSIPICIGLLKYSQINKIDFSLAITTDEEIGGYDGGQFLANEIKYRPSYLIVPDGGDNLTFVNKAKGVCQLIVTVKGAPAHASRPWKGKSALDSIIKIANELLKIYDKNSIKENWNTTMNIGQIQGGTSINQVCPEAFMKLDFRYPQTDSIKNITETVNKIARNITKNFKITPASTGLPTFTDTRDEIIQTFLKCMENIYKKNIVITHTYGASDSRHFAKYNIPILMMKPIGGEIHSEDEWVSISSSLKFYEGLKTFIDQTSTKI